jgi:hypothetical protein
VGDLLGTGLLAVAFEFLYLVGDRDSDVGDWAAAVRNVSCGFHTETAFVSELYVPLIFMNLKLFWQIVLDFEQIHIFLWHAE